MLTVGLYGIRDTSTGGGPTYTHDHSIAIMREGRVVDVVPLERVTRVKHDNRLDVYIGSLLAERIGDEPVRFASVNAFVGDAFISADGNLRIEPQGPVPIRAAPVPARVRWWPDGIHPRETKGWAVCHEIAHVASLLPFVGRFEPESLLAHIDGGASDSACSAWWWDGVEARLLESSWDLLKDPLNNFNVGPLGRLALGLKPGDHLSMPGKLMGFAGHGHADTKLLAWLRKHRFFLGHNDAAVRGALESHFGKEIPWADIAATIQTDFEERVATQILRWQQQTGARRLYYAGGAGLNIPTNVLLENSGRFDAVHVPPCTNDTGLALGAAAWIEYRERGHVALHDAFLSRADTEAATMDQIDQIAELIAGGAILGLCNGNAEIGPRALGQRSIIARPDDIALRKRVSEDVKRRESYRPVAPMLLAEIALEAFGPDIAHSQLAPFMVGAWKLRPEWEACFSGVIHADGTLRAQVVSDANVFLSTLLRRLWHCHKIAGLINTSFNGPGEPIVHTRSDALASARRIGLDGVVIEGVLHRL